MEENEIRDRLFHLSMGLKDDKELIRAHLRSLLDDTELPWPEVAVPELQESKYGDWEISVVDPPPALRGYFKGLQCPVSKNYVLLRKGLPWMSCTPMELETQMPSIAAASGCTVVMGIGMGITLFNILAKPEVTKVIAIEKEEAVIKLFDSIPGEWPGIEKLRIIRADALSIGLALPVDFLYVDIWEHLGEEKALENVIRAQERIKAKKVGYWGQEIDFVDWCRENVRSLPFTEQDYDDWRDSTGIPLIKADNHWVWAVAAVRNMVLS